MTDYLQKGKMLMCGKMFYIWGWNFTKKFSGAIWGSHASDCQDYYHLGSDAM